ncbi:MAG TPA: copper chaperone PCu(A)C [Anaerolineales bacterium]|nr:copper chaperone PCu(A)C [Anaerolineales bacterium]
MKRILFVLTVTLLLVACSPESGSGIDVHGAWARPARQGENGVVYFLLENHTTETHELIAAISGAAEAVEIHESRMTGDVMQMQKLESVSLGPGAEVAFEPGGLHVMLIGLKQELKRGDQIELTLQFRNFKDFTVQVPVQEAPADAGEH